MTTCYTSVTYRERAFDGKGDIERSMLLIGSPEEIGKQIGEFVQRQIEFGGRVLTITPIDPANVWKVSE